jgi:hypothetical protein
VRSPGSSGRALCVGVIVLSRVLDWLEVGITSRVVEPRPDTVGQA